MGNKGESWEIPNQDFQYPIIPDWLNIWYQYPYPIRTRSDPKYFFQYPIHTRPEVKKPYPSDPAPRPHLGNFRSKFVWPQIRTKIYEENWPAITKKDQNHYQNFHSTYKKSAKKNWGWKWPPPHSECFRKFIHFGGTGLPYYVIGLVLRPLPIWNGLQSNYIKIHSSETLTQWHVTDWQQ